MPTNTIKPVKSKTATILLALFLGTFGAHHFYLKQYWRAVFSILFFWTWIPTLVSWIDVIIFAVMSQDRFDNKYNSFVTNSSVQNCSGCGTSLTFMSTPNFGGGKLRDGGRVCRGCFGIIVKVDIDFGRNSSKEYDTYLVRQVLSKRSAASLSSSNSNYTTSIPTSKSKEELKKHIEEARLERSKIETEIKQQQLLIRRLESKLRDKQRGFGRLFAKDKQVKNLQDNLKESNEYLVDLCSQYEESQVNISIESDNEIQEQYQKVKDAYIDLSRSNKIWDIVSERTNTEAKSSAVTNIDRKEVSFTLEDIDFILSENSAFHLENANGDNLHIYPTFILQLDHSGAITLIDLQDLRFSFRRLRFLEEKTTVPSDTQVVDYTWAKVNKDGSPDKRFSGNYQIPVVEYGAFEFSTNSGLREVYYISNLQFAERFNNEFRKYLSFLTPTIDISVPEKITLSSNGTKSKVFSYPYYSLLKDFSKSLLQVVHKLQTNEAILEHINDEQLQSTVSEFITNCVIYDMIQVSNILVGGRLSEESLEATGLVLTTNQLLLNNSEYMLDKDFDSLATAHQHGFYQDVARQLIEIGAVVNPLQITIKETQNKKTTSSSKQENSLAFPTFLKISDNPLFEEYVTVLYRYATIISKADNIVSESEEKLLKEIYKRTHHPIFEKRNEALHISKGDKNESLDEVLSQLNSLIGLDKVKAEVNTLINFIKVQKVREQSGLKSSSLSYHIVFTGNPGTGKTTVARIVSKIYKHLGIVSEGQLVETDRSGLVAEYSGQTAVKVNKTVDSALNGILFIDEAYSLIGENKDDFGREAVATLIKRMEDDRDKLVLILAGYTDEMAGFMQTNPGVKSRFNRYISFPDYTPNELFEIFESMCNKLDYHLTEEAKVKLNSVFENAYSIRDKSFGNGRFVRNIFEKSLEQQANRIAKESSLTIDILTAITENDIVA